MIYFLGTHVLFVLHNPGVHVGHASVRLQYRSDKCTRKGKYKNKLLYHNISIIWTFIYYWSICVYIFQNIEKFIKDVFETRYKKNMESGRAELLYSFVVSIFAIGGMLGGFCGGIIANRFGRQVDKIVINNNYILCH